MSSKRWLKGFKRHAETLDEHFGSLDIQTISVLIFQEVMSALLEVPNILVLNSLDKLFEQKLHK